MPTNKNAMTRYQILDTLLSDRYHNYSLDDLTEEVNLKLSEFNPKTDGVGRRTIEKDIDYLENEEPFMVEIERYSAPGYSTEKMKNYMKRCLRYTEVGFSIFKKEMSDDERYLLSETLSMIGQFDGLPELEALESFRKDLNVVEKQKIISFTKNPIGGSNILGDLFARISHRQVVELQYHRGFEDFVSSVVVSPYLLKEYNRRWFLFARPENEKQVFPFGLERIEEVTPLPSKRYVEYKGDINELFEDIVGVTNYYERKINHIVFWGNDASKDYVTTKPLHDSQIHYKGEALESFRKQYPMLDSGAFFSIDCKENYELVRDLASFGENLLVLSPKNIQDAVYKRAAAMLRGYDALKNSQKLRT